MCLFRNPAHFTKIAFLVHISNAAAPLPAAPAPALGLLGTAVAPAVTPLVRPPFFAQNPLVLAGATAGLGAAAIGSPGIVVPPIVSAVDAIGQPSEYLLLKNMFDPSTEVSSLSTHVLCGPVSWDPTYIFF
jgi:hypothetical protein